MKLTPEGWVFLVVLAFITVGAVLRNVNLLVVLAGMMYAPLLLNWRMGIRWLKSINASRRVPQRLHANELISVQWTCENQIAGMAAWNLVINDRITALTSAEQLSAHSVSDAVSVSDVDTNTDSVTKADPAIDSDSVSEGWMSRWFGEIYLRLKREKTSPNSSEVKLGFVRVNGGHLEVQSYRTFFSHRGRFRIGPAAISTTFPFGLIVSRIHFPKTETITVGPEIGELHPTWERRVQSFAVGSDAIKRRRALEEDEFYALRPWRSGDCKKNIHWRTSAKYGQPIVKQHDQPNNRDFALLLDLFLDPNDEDRSRSHAELALSFVATTMLQIGSAVQGQIAIGICGRETELCQSRSRQVIVNEVMQRLAVADPHEDPQVAEIVLQLSALVSTGTPIYVISSRPRPASFDLQQPRTTHESPQSDRAARLLARVVPLLRWLEVGSGEFNSIFSMSNDPIQETRLQRFSSRWSANAKR